MDVFCCMGKDIKIRVNRRSTEEINFKEFGTKQMRVFRQAQQPPFGQAQGTDKSEHSPKLSY